MKNIQKISKFLLSTVALLVPVLSVSASYDKTKDISTEPEAGLHARNRPEARLKKERNDLATLTEGREHLAANLRDLGEERFEIEKERVAKLALLSEEKISRNSEVPEFKSELFKKGKLIYSDNFDGELNREFWGQSKGKKMEDGKLIIGPLFQSKEEAMKVYFCHGRKPGSNKKGFLGCAIISSTFVVILLVQASGVGETIWQVERQRG